MTFDVANRETTKFQSFMMRAYAYYMDTQKREKHESVGAFEDRMMDQARCYAYGRMGTEYPERHATHHRLGIGV